MMTDTTCGALLGYAPPTIVALTPSTAALHNGDNRHGDWLTERTRMQAQAEAMCDADDGACETLAYDRLCTTMLDLEQRILATPAANVAEAQAKLRLAAIIDAEGMMLEANEAAKLLAEIAPFLAGDR